MNRKLMFAFLALSLPGAVSAQTHDMSGMAQSPAMVGGSKHPEQISDSFAYRNWFELAARSLSNPRHQDAVFNTTGLSKDDQAKLLPAVISFQIEEREIISAYNAQAAEADSSSRRINPVVVAQFWSDMVELVEKTKLTINHTLSAPGVTQLQNHIQARKARMLVPSGQQ